jgi:hypothetical protein
MISPPSILWDCLGLQTFKGIWKWNFQIAHKRRNCSPFVGTELVLGVSRQNIQKQIKRWMDNQHVAKWPVLLVLRNRLKN